MGNICKSFIDTKRVGNLSVIGKLKELMIGAQAKQAIDLKVLEEKLEAMGINTTRASVMPPVTPVVPEVTPSTPLVQANPTNPIVAAGSAIIGQDITQPIVNKVNDTIVSNATTQNLNTPVIDMPTVQPATVHSVPLQMEEPDKSIENVINEQVAPVLDDKNQSLSTPQEVAQVENLTVSNPMEIQNPITNNVSESQIPVSNAMEEPKTEEITSAPVSTTEPLTPSVQDPFVEAVAEIEKVRSEFNNNCDKVNTYLEKLKSEINSRLDEISRRAEAQRQTFNTMNKQVSIDNSAINTALQSGIQNLNNNQIVTR